MDRTDRRVASLIPEAQRGDPTEHQRSETIAGFALRYGYDPEAAYSRRRLPRLKLGIDTAQRTFYCIYDYAFCLKPAAAGRHPNELG